ncbi:MAG: 6-phosphofructokinase, partial [Alphaproteobacteria bacterium]|nr:6-phosphofructokinase [Alphaproteobacteria bacterium]
MTKRIGVLTSGGDCAGLNATIRAIVHKAVGSYGARVFGIKKGTTGLITRPLDYIELTPEICDTDLMRKGGTFLGSTNKDNPFHFPTPGAVPGSKEAFTDRSAD